ncbi:MAG: hypothetical protein JSS86_12505 [Cyanobacteria bacterium SZAS LIN-2]|nr:hypothetical protein [Cyanobacteria bacterium SZAS LIN-3]MBS1997132.1 hypothetical protein [Cyanobacteria bacterium SZAS LIN-2]MBS2008182.1 hypothetical protein [Cyanobacteria bacterium SZAS TMP-1]
MPGGRFGRIRPDTIQLFEKTVEQVKKRMLSALPPSAGDQVKAYTTEALLTIVFRDWLEHENSTGLEDSDVADLESFVKCASSMAGSDINGQGYPVYQAILKGLLEDWLENWNAPGDPGPPGPG